MEKEVLALVDMAIQMVASYGLDVLGAVLILIIGWIIAGWCQKLTTRALGKFPRFDNTLRPLASNLVRYTILAFVIVAVLNRFGVETTSIIAVMGAAGLAIGLALQGTLSNVAAGVMLLVLRPFKVGDYVDAGGIAGTVIEVGLFTTQLKTFDGVYLMAPNSQLWNTPIMNYSRNETRRIDVIAGISYGDDMDAAMKMLLGLLTNDTRVLKDPEPQVLVSALADSAVNLDLRCWVKGDDYWGTLFDLNRLVKVKLEENGFSIPFPQMDVHMVANQDT